MHFKPFTQEQLKALNLEQNKKYKIQYLNIDYFNGEETLETADGTAIISEGKITFIVPDPYGMDRFIEKVIVL